MKWSKLWFSMHILLQFKASQAPIIRAQIALHFLAWYIDIDFLNYQFYVHELFQTQNILPYSGRGE